MKMCQLQMLQGLMSEYTYRIIEVLQGTGGVSSRQSSRNRLTQAPTRYGSLHSRIRTSLARSEVDSETLPCPAHSGPCWTWASSSGDPGKNGHIGIWSAGIVGTLRTFAKVTNFLQLLNLLWADGPCQALAPKWFRQTTTQSLESPPMAVATPVTITDSPWMGMCSKLVPCQQLIKKHPKFNTYSHIDS